MCKTPLLALAVPLALAACGGDQSAAETAVRAALRDPDSAKFGAFHYNSDTQRACLTVNAKNAMGGYTGDRQAHVVRTDAEWHFEDEKEETHEECRTGWSAQTDDLSAVADRVRGGRTSSVVTNIDDPNFNISAYTAARARGEF